MKKTPVLLLALFLYSSISIFSQINFISPLEGVWANKQMLLIDDAGEGEYLYSIDGSDPETFGFAYDGPVLLDVTDNVQINVTHILPNGKKEKNSVSYSVKIDDAESTSYKDFIKTFIDSGIINYSAGSKLVIPSSLKFSFGLPPDSFITGTELSINKDCVYSRYIPCVIYDEVKNIKYRFIVKILPQSAGSVSKRDLPFSITDWNTINFNDDDFIYKIDSEYWGLPKKPVKIDRSVSHMISWQPLEYDAANNIEFFVLPPKPEVKKDVLLDGSIIYSLEENGDYKLSIYSKEKKSYTDYFDKIGFDVFEGDKLDDNITIGVFANSLYQGQFETKVQINKRPPVLPQVKTTAKGFYSRDKVDLEIAAENGCELYIALSDPVTLNSNKVLYSSENSYLKNIPVGEFKYYKKDFKITWTQKGVGPMFYKVQAYSKNSVNSSQIVEYSVIIDQSNYYYDKNADSEVAEGTAEHPFTSFEQCVNSLKNNRATNLNIKGELIIDKAYDIKSNIKFINDENGSITFKPEGSIQITGATVEINNFNIVNQSDSKVINIIPFFNLKNAVLNIDDCMISSSFEKNGTLIDSYNSIININDSLFGINSGIYGSYISSVKSRININKTTVSVNADTSVIFSGKDGTINVNDSNLVVSGKTGRIAELFGVKALFKNNKIKADFTSEANQNIPFYVNKATVLKDEDNEKIGF